jgi:hypothetical protein
VYRLEALADSIASLNDWSNPVADAYQLRNPGLLRAFTLRHAADDAGRRIFPSLVDGYQALLYDLQRKCTGLSRSKLKPTDPLVELLIRGFSQPPSAEEYVLCFLTSALPRLNVTAHTPLKFFVEETK